MENSGKEVEILALVGQLRDVVANSYPDPASVAPLRWQIAQTLLEHCERKDRAVTDVREDVAARRRADHAAVCCLFAHYIADWSVGRVAAEWERFGKETEDVAASLIHVVQGCDAEPCEVRQAA